MSNNVINTLYLLTLEQKICNIIMTETNTYPYMLRRCASSGIDMLFLLFFVINIAGLFDNIGLLTLPVKVALFCTFFLYEPLMVAYACTFGQLITRIRVRRLDNPAQQISLGNSFVRYILKNIIGIISFFTVHSNPERRAIHDLAVNSVVIKK